MTIEEKVQAVLAAAATVTALVPAAKISTPGDRQNVTSPYVEHFAVAADPTTTHEGQASLCAWAYQVSIFHSAYSGGRTIADLVRSALNGVHTTDGNVIHGIWSGMRHYYEAEVGLHHFALEFDIYESIS